MTAAVRKKTPAPVHDLLWRAMEALSWCGGSADFAPGGKARRGWLKVRPLIDELTDAAYREKRKALPPAAAAADDFTFQVAAGRGGWCWYVYNARNQPVSSGWRNTRGQAIGSAKISISNLRHGKGVRS